ncbi:kinase-like domain-containing protein [Lactarius akahatsu]|uniref:Kinase-like domain-containing protein n=1 Tax=Lactarius akahatsu TaxID=416441 RepID=A0AAD4LC06_9AGAM|nr:kinase-like domain-containing protein [Lactarius akahatsu]
MRGTTPHQGGLQEITFSVVSSPSPEKRRVLGPATVGVAHKFGTCRERAPIAMVNSENESTATVYPAAGYPTPLIRNSGTGHEPTASSHCLRFFTMINTGPPRPAGGEYGDVRATIDEDKLNVYLAKNVPAVAVPVTVKQFKFGQSNPTYFLTDARGLRFVLRKKPAGQLVSQTAHQVEREYTVLAAIHKHNSRPTTPPESRVPVPQFLEGRIFTDMSMPGVSPEVRRECWLSAVCALGALSSLDPRQVGLEKFGSHKPYFPRQIKSLSKVTHAQAAVEDIDTGKPVGEIPGWGELIAWYEQNLPDERKTGNRVVGILDWELCTLGSPLADLANLTQLWVVDPDETGGHLVGYKNRPSTEPISLAELEREYCRVTRQPYPITEIVFARSWMLIRLAVIMQGIAARHARRQASSEQAHLYAGMFPVFGRLARVVLEDEGHSQCYDQEFHYDVRLDLKVFASIWNMFGA